MFDTEESFWIGRFDSLLTIHMSFLYQEARRGIQGAHIIQVRR